MKLRFYVCTCAVLLVAFAAAGYADQATDDYTMWMKAAAGANGMMQKNMAGDLKAAAANAADVQANFAKIEAFWSMRGASDAVGFSKAIEAAAKEAQDAANAGDMAGAQAAAKKIGPNCGMCHMAHRAKDDSGAFTIK
jgi:cytochrome c556